MGCLLGVCVVGVRMHLRGRVVVEQRCVVEDSAGGEQSQATGMRGLVEG